MARIGRQQLRANPANRREKNVIHNAFFQSTFVKHRTKYLRILNIFSKEVKFTPIFSLIIYFFLPSLPNSSVFSVSHSKLPTCYSPIPCTLKSRFVHHSPTHSIILFYRYSVHRPLHRFLYIPPLGITHNYLNHSLHTMTFRQFLIF